MLHDPDQLATATGRPEEASRDLRHGTALAYRQPDCWRSHEQEEC